MVKTILTTSRGNSGSTGIPSGTPTYYRVGNATLLDNLTIARAEVIWRTPGVFSKLYVRIVANTRTAISTIHLRVNGVNVTNTVDIPAGFVGVIEDTTHSDTIANGDTVVYRVVTGAGGSLTIALISIIFDATTDCVSKQVNHGYAPATASITHYANISGRFSGVTTVEGNTEATVKKPGVAKNLFFYVSSNPRTTPTTFTLRKNRTDTAITITVPAGEFGIYEDTTNSISYAVNDEINWKITTGAGTELLQMWSLTIDYITPQEGFINATAVGASGDITLGPGVTEYYVVGGGMIEGTTTEADAAITARDAFTLSNLTVYARANTITAASTVTLMKNGSPTAMTLSIDSTAAGFFSDSTNPVTFEAGDTMSYKVVTGGTGTTLTISQMAVWSGLVVAPVIGSGGGSQGRSPLYRQVRRREPDIAIAIVRVRVPLEYEVEKLSVQVKGPLLVPQNQKPLIKYASAVLSVIERILPLPIRPTPIAEQKIVRVSIPLTYEVTNLQLKAACSYQVERLFTQKEQHKIVATSINFLLSDLI